MGKMGNVEQQQAPDALKWPDLKPEKAWSVASWAQEKMTWKLESQIAGKKVHPWESMEISYLWKELKLTISKDGKTLQVALDWRIYEWKVPWYAGSIKSMEGKKGGIDVQAVMWQTITLAELQTAIMQMFKKEGTVPLNKISFELQQDVKMAQN